MVRRRDPDLQAAFGRAVRERRQAIGLSQEELAEAADLHRTYIGDIERGGRNVSLVNIARIADALGSTASELLALAEAEARSHGGA